LCGQLGSKKLLPKELHRGLFLGFRDHRVNTRSENMHGSSRSNESLKCTISDFGLLASFLVLIVSCADPQKQLSMNRECLARANCKRSLDGRLSPLQPGRRVFWIAKSHDHRVNDRRSKCPKSAVSVRGTRGSWTAMVLERLRRRWPPTQESRPGGKPRRRRVLRDRGGAILRCDNMRSP